MKNLIAIFGTLLISLTAGAAGIKDFAFQCQGSNGLFIDQSLSGGTFYDKDGQMTINLISHEAQLRAFESGVEIPEIESASLTISNKSCVVDYDKDLDEKETDRVKSIWCFVHSLNPLRPMKPVEVVITQKGGKTTKFEQTDFKMTLSDIILKDPVSTTYGKKSLEVNVDSKYIIEDKIKAGKSFVLFKGNNLSCF